MSGASPQLEDGYIRIANELMDAILRAPLTGRELLVLLSIIRKTYGFNKKEDDISASQLGKLCNLSRPHVTEALNALARKNIITKRIGTHGCVIGIQKNHRKWTDDPLGGIKRTPHGDLEGNHYTYRITDEETGEFYIGVRTCKCLPTQDRYKGSGQWVSERDKRKLTKIITGQFATREAAHLAEQEQIRQLIGDSLMKNVIVFRTGRTDGVHGCTETVHGVPESPLTSTDSVQVASTDSVHTKDNVPKDNEQKTKSCAPQADREAISGEASGDRRSGRGRRVADRFAEFYAAYPRKKSKQSALKAFTKLNPDEELLAQIIAGIGRAMKSEQWRDSRYIPHPATWLNAGGWMDEIRVEYSTEQLEVISAYNTALGDTLGHVDANIFVAKRAGMIADFLGLSPKPGFHQVYFDWVRGRCDLPPHVGFDWLITRETFTKIKGGQFERKDRP